MLIDAWKYSGVVGERRGWDTGGRGRGDAVMPFLYHTSIVEFCRKNMY